MRFFDNNRGFSLVELLGVVAIIGILAAGVIFNVQAGKEKARDAQRLTDLQQLEIALRLYKDVHGAYPETCPADTSKGGSGAWRSPGPGDAGWYTECEEYIIGLVPDYIHELPKDPKSEDENNLGFYYRVTDDLKDYKIMVEQTVERDGPDGIGAPYLRGGLPTCPFETKPHLLRDNTYAIYSSGQGAPCW